MCWGVGGGGGREGGGAGSLTLVKIVCLPSEKVA